MTSQHGGAGPCCLFVCLFDGRKFQDKVFVFCVEIILAFHGKRFLWFARSKEQFFVL